MAVVEIWDITTMHIIIDARLINETGVGRYIRNLITYLDALHNTTRYSLLLRKGAYDEYTVPSSRFRKVLADVPWHSVSEQIIIAKIAHSLNASCLHVPYHNPSLFYPGKMVLTVHDLIVAQMPTGKATTLPYPFYLAKKFGYHMEMALGVRRANQIIAVSHTTKDALQSYFHVNPNKLSVVYEGVDTVFFSRKKPTETIEGGKYFLYVGNAYPHKNVESLIRGFQMAVSRLPSGYSLVCVGKNDIFYEKLRIIVTQNGWQNIMFDHDVTEEKLRAYYMGAQAFVTASNMEGFGLPGLEAMACITPVVCSDIPVFREIYKNAAFYFNQSSPASIADALLHIATNSTLRRDLKEQGKARVSDFSWQGMALNTHRIYERAVGSV